MNLVERRKNRSHYEVVDELTLARENEKGDMLRPVSISFPL